MNYPFHFRHDPQEASVGQLINVKNIREFSRLVRDAVANIHCKEMKNLLGSVTVPLAVSPHAWIN